MTNPTPNTDDWPDLLQAVLDGVATPEEQRRFAEALRADPARRAEYRESVEVDAALRAAADSSLLGRNVPEVSAGRRFFWPSLAAAAAALVLLAGYGYAAFVSARRAQVAVVAPAVSAAAEAPVAAFAVYSNLTEEPPALPLPAQQELEARQAQTQTLSSAVAEVAEANQTQIPVTNTTVAVKETTVKTIPALMVAAYAATQSVVAQTYTWERSGAQTANWSAISWSPGALPTGGGTGVGLVFAGDANTWGAVNDLGDFTLNSLTISAGIGTVSGSKLVFAANGTVGPTLAAASAAGAQTVSAPVELAANLTVSASKNLTLSGTVSGSGKLAADIATNAILTLSGANTYSGGTELRSGILSASPAALGTGSILVTNNAATLVYLYLNGSGTLANAIRLDNELGQVNYAYRAYVAANQAVTLTGPLAMNGARLTAGKGSAVHIQGGITGANYVSLFTEGGTNWVTDSPITVTNGTKYLFVGGDNIGRTILGVQGNQVKTVGVHANGCLQWGMDSVLPDDVAFYSYGNRGYCDLHGYSQIIGSLKETRSSNDGDFSTLFGNQLQTARSTLTVNQTASSLTYDTIAGNLDIDKSGIGTLVLGHRLGTSGALTVSEGALNLGGLAHSADELILDGGMVSDGTLYASTNILRSGSLENVALRSGDIVKEGSGTVTLKPCAASGSLPSGTVLYYPFDSAATLLQDASGNGVTLTASTGTPAFSAEGRCGGALYLDGSTTLTAIGGFPSIMPGGAAPYTVAAFIKMADGCNVNGGWFGYGSAATRQCNCFRLNGSYGGIVNYWYETDVSVPFADGVTVADGRWHSVIGTWDGTRRRIYLDGVMVSVETLASAPNIQATGFVIGKTIADKNFTGWLDDLLVLNRAMNFHEAQAWHYTGTLGQRPGTTAATRKVEVNAGTLVAYAPIVTDQDSALALHYRFDNAANLFADSSTHGNTLAPASGKRALAYSSDGKFGGALRCDGTNYLTTASGAFPVGMPSGSAPFTVCTCVKADSASSTRGSWLGYGTLGSACKCNGFRLNETLNGVLNWWWGADISVTLPNAGTFANTWHSVISTYDGTTRCLYLDGTLVNSTTQYKPAFTTNSFYVGCDLAVSANVPDPPLTGYLDDVAIFSRALSATEVAQVAVSGIASSAAPALPTNSEVTVSANATLQIPNGDQAVESLSGTGTLSARNITVTGRLSVAPLHIDGDLTLATNAVIAVEQAALSPVVVNGSVDISKGGTVTFASGDMMLGTRKLITGTFATAGELKNWTVPQAAGGGYIWSVFVKNDALWTSVSRKGGAVILR